jgi:heme-degrading monooxygenase HmoA
VYNGPETRPKEYAVHARVSSYEGDVDRLIDGFGRQTHLLQQLEGFGGAHLLVDRGGGRALTVTLWDSEEALSASASRAAHLRDEATETAAATIGSVDSYEVAVTVDRGDAG